MIEVYWYISKAKLDLLKDASPAFLRGISATASFRLPGFEGNLSGAVAPNLVKDLQRVVKRLEADQSLKHYHELGDDEAPVMMRFEGTGGDACFTRRLLAGYGVQGKRIAPCGISRLCHRTPC